MAFKLFHLQCWAPSEMEKEGSVVSSAANAATNCDVSWNDEQASLGRLKLQYLLTSLATINQNAFWTLRTTTEGIRPSVIFHDMLCCEPARSPTHSCVHLKARAYNTNEGRLHWIAVLKQLCVSGYVYLKHGKPFVGFPISKGIYERKFRIKAVDTLARLPRMPRMLPTASSIYGRSILLPSAGCTAKQAAEVAENWVVSLKYDIGMFSSIPAKPSDRLLHSALGLNLTRSFCHMASPWATFLSGCVRWMGPPSLDLLEIKEVLAARLKIPKLDAPNQQVLLRLKVFVTLDYKSLIRCNQIRKNLCITRASLSTLSEKLQGRGPLEPQLLHQKDAAQQNSSVRLWCALQSCDVCHVEHESKAMACNLEAFKPNIARLAPRLCSSFRKGPSGNPSANILTLQWYKDSWQYSGMLMQLNSVRSCTKTKSTVASTRFNDFEMGWPVILNSGSTQLLFLFALFGAQYAVLKHAYKCCEDQRHRSQKGSTHRTWQDVNLFREVLRSPSVLHHFNLKSFGALSTFQSQKRPHLTHQDLDEPKVVGSKKQHKPATRSCI